MLSVFRTELKHQRYPSQQKSSFTHGTGAGAAWKWLQGPGGEETLLYLEMKRNREIATSHQIHRKSTVSGDSPPAHSQLCLPYSSQPAHTRILVIWDPTQHGLPGALEHLQITGLCPRRLGEGGLLWVLPVLWISLS